LGWKHAFEDLGHQFDTLTAEDIWPEKVAVFKPDLFFSTNFIDLHKHREDLQRMRASGILVFINVSWPMSRSDLSVLKEGSVAHVYFGEREPESMREFQQVTRLSYVLIPNAADKLLHFPTHPLRKYECEIAFLGSYFTQKNEAFDRILIPLCKKYHAGLW